LAVLVVSTFAALAPGNGSAPALVLHHPGVVASATAPSGAAPVTGPGVGARPTEISAGMGWMGVDYRSACLGCLPADPQLAVGAGYVLELTNGTERVWLVNGTQVANQSLDSLFNASFDTLTSPQVQFDQLSLHWFASVEDLSTDQILLAASASSDPTANWNVVSITPSNGSVPGGPLLAVDSTDVVLTANESSPNGSFEGAQVWVANESSLLTPDPVAPVAVGGPDPETDALVPVVALSDSSTLYLVDDGFGSHGSFQLFSLNGTPPDTVTLSGPTNFTTNVSAPPNAVQPGTPELLAVGPGTLQSAAWRADTLWAVASGACTPANDSQARSCLHLWEVDTATGVLEQDFTWSTGAGTYDFDPAVSIAVRGDLALVFGESSATVNPSILATGQAITDPSGTLEAPVWLHNGTGPDTPTTGCTATVCPFGSDFAIAFTPATNVHFWAVGEFTGKDAPWNYWKTWINQVAAWATVPVTFSESGLPAGTDWSVTVNGETATSTASSLTVDEQNGSYTFVILSPVSGAPGVRYVATSTGGTFTVDAASVVETLAFEQQFSLTASASPAGDGDVYPGGGWFDASSVVSLSALAEPGFAFESWTGSGPGAYTGISNPADLTIGAPIIEVAHYWASATYPVTFTESGLAARTNWTVSLNGVLNGSTGPTVGFNEPNGTYTFAVTSVLPGTPGTQYVATSAGGSFSLDGGAARLAVTYLPQFELAAGPVTQGTGVVNPSSGWFAAGAVVNLSALAGPGELFVGWTGFGSGAYTGPVNPAPVVLDAPVTEQARFDPATTYPVTYTESGLPAGTSWSVTTNGVRATSTSPTVVFNEANGSYSFGVPTARAGANGSVYVPTPTFGSLTVFGGPVRESIQFATTAAPTTSPGSQTSSADASGIPIWVFGAALAAFFIVVAVLVLFAQARSSASREPIVTYVTAPSPPDWDESHLQGH
jgi:List-Bact-rpt repeat protein